MAKKRNPGIVEPGTPGTGTAAVRTRRRTVKASAPETTLATQPVAGNGDQHTAVANAPASEQIARLAYSYWEARGCQGGSPEEDWHRAEQELRARA